MVKIEKTAIMFSVVLICLCIASDSFASITFGPFGKKRSFPELVTAEEVCDRARNNAVLQRYLEVTDRIYQQYYLLLAEDYGIYEDSPKIKIDFRLENFDSNRRGVDEFWGGSRHGEFFNNGRIVRDWIAKKYREESKKVNFGFDGQWLEKQKFEIYKCALELRGTDEFRLFTASGPNKAQYEGGCSRSDQLLCEDAIDASCQQVLDLNGDLIEQCEDTLKRPRVPNYYLERVEGVDWHRGLIFFLLVMEGGENVLSGIGNQILDSWEQRIPLLVAEVQNLIDTENAQKLRKQMRVEAEKRRLGNIPPVEKEYASLYASFAMVENCYEMRRGYAVVYINDVQFNRATEIFLKAKKDLGISADAAKRIEEEAGEGLRMLRQMSVTGNYSEGGKEVCDTALMALSSH